MKRTMGAILACLVCTALAGGHRADGGEASTPEAAPFPYATTTEIDVADLRARLTWVADDARRGRDATSPEAMEVSAHIATSFDRSGLLPKGTDGWYQPFTVAEPILGDGNALTVTIDGEATSYEVEKDWNPFSVSAAADVDAEVVFAGYGISAPDREYDEYAGPDVKGRVVLVLRKNPGWQEVQHASFLNKLKVAAEAGAAAVLLCNNPDTTKDGPDRIGHWSASLGAPAASAPIPYAFVSQTLADRLLAARGTSLAEVEPRLRASGPCSGPVPGARVHLVTTLTATQGANARNVVGLLPGCDPEVANEVVVIGAHYDHVGLGWFGSTGGASAAGQIHNGADDNGSGTVALMELAEWFAAEGHRPRRSLLFIAFTGEERGLLGSQWYVDHPTVPLEDTVGMVNLDMIGRSKEGRVQVGGVGTAKGLHELVEGLNKEHHLNCLWDPGGVAPSDSTSFFRKNLPVLFFFTLLHEDYHRPTDDVERIEFPGLERITLFVRDVVHEIAARDERLVFTKPPTPPRPPRLGVQASPEPHDIGVLVAGVAPGGPAAEAGVVAGDVLVSLAGQATRDRQGLVEALRRLEPGKRIDLVVLRGDEQITLKVLLAAPGRR
ncbi:MAG: M20/M25/M40 family metallo-hydrolase [Planctomycetota bacterium]